MEQPVSFKPKPLVDEDEISLLEYSLQLAFFTTDLHITNSWSFCTKEELEAFENTAKEAFKGSVLSLWFDMNKLEPPQSFENSAASGELNIDYTNQLFEYGTISPPSGFQANPTGTFRMLLFKVAMGRIHSYEPDKPDFHGIVSSYISSDEFLKAEIPQGFDSSELVTNNELKLFNALYRVSDPAQVLLYAAVEFEFTPLKVQVPEPVCEMCESAMAKWYCHSDRAHFCNACDLKQHNSTRIFSRHIRIPCSKSPNQFGLCEHHPTDVVDMVCLKVRAPPQRPQCCCLLCNNCILFGRHSDPRFFDHPLMSTLDTYDLSLEKNSESDERLKFRRDEISDKIKTRHNSTSQIYANSKGVEARIDYCRGLLLEQLGEMRNKKLRYLNSVQRELRTQLKLIQWMQNFLNHLYLSLEPCQFIMFKRRYDLLVKKYFTSDLRDFLDFPVWMNKELELSGDARISCSSVNRLSRTFSGAGDSARGAASGRDSGQSPSSNQNLIDWTPLNLYDNMEETVGRLTLRPIDVASTECDMSSSASYGELEDPVKANARTRAPNELDVLDTATKLWNFLSDYKMGTVVQLLKLVEATERGQLVRHVFTLANHFEQVPQLLSHLANYEMNALSSDFGHCVLLRSSGVLSDVFAFLFCSELTARENSEFLAQLSSPLDRYFELYLAASGAKDADAAALDELVSNCMVEIVAKLVALDVLALPASFQYAVYALCDLFAKLQPRYSCCVVVDFFCSVLSYHLLRCLNQRALGALVITPCSALGPLGEDSESSARYGSLKGFTRELSFKFARACIVVWALDSVSLGESTEARQSQKMFDWAEKLLAKPRVRARLALNPAGWRELDESCNFVLRQVARFEKRLSSGQVDISYKRASELTAKYNFVQLFRMAHQLAL